MAVNPFCDNFLFAIYFFISVRDNKNKRVSIDMGLKLENLTLLRKEKRLSQADLAQIFNVAQNTVSNWENGEREPDNITLVRLAEYFGVSTDYLLGKTIVRRPIETVAAHREDDFRNELPPEKQEEIERFIKFAINEHRQKQGLPPI
jgi:transcriptional regulator with XRE-family HTH domain